MHDPLIKWFSQEFNVPPLTVVSGTVLAQHPEETLTAIQWLLFHLDDWTLSGLDTLSQNAKSLVIPLAVWRQRIGLKEALTACRVEEEFQTEHWGVVEGGHDLEFNIVDIKVAAASFFLGSIPHKPLPAYFTGASS